jgi:hypothetical protein
VFGGVFYMIFCESNVQPWASTNNNDNNNNSELKQKGKDNLAYYTTEF